ncbi:MAG: hypothetical protein ACE5EX_11455, partial [Phycisphaerae bacterium]
MPASRAHGSLIVRCPACGQRLQPGGSRRCPVCAYDLGDDRVTGDDVTPYARAFALRTTGWWPMAEWVWFAGSGRLKHLGLVRASAASRRFLMINLLCLSGALGVLQLSRLGWRSVSAYDALEPGGSAQPAGAGWLHVAAAPRPLPPDQPAEIQVDLWWNPVQALLGAALAAPTALLVLILLVAVVRAGLARAHTPAYRGEQRMTAAIHYASAWSLPVMAGALVAALRPIAYIGNMTQWPWYPPQRLFLIAGAVLSGFGVAMGWFWLVRCAAAAPPGTRTRVVSFVVLAAP